jgi:hypothetical protein
MIMTREETWAKLVELDVVDGEMPEGDWNLSGSNLSEAALSGAGRRDVMRGDGAFRNRIVPSASSSQRVYK